jgi:hypothetical protein
MERAFDFSGDREADWATLCQIWRQSNTVMSGAVGATWVMPPEHKVCLEFAEAYPESKQFLLGHLADLNPVIAAYAFKTLIRIGELERSEVPPELLARQEEVTVHVHSRLHSKILGDFFSEYFGSADHESITEADERAVSWQDNELAQYLEATRNPRPAEPDGSGD